MEARRWGEALPARPGPRGGADCRCALGGLAITLERCLAAAKAMGDRLAEAWALHQSGTRAVCRGEPAAARALLSQAVQLREAQDDDGAADVSRRNLSFVLRPLSEKTAERPAMPFDDVPGLDVLPVRDAARAAVQIPKTRRIAAAVLTMVLFAMLGAVGYSAARAHAARSQGSVLPRRRLCKRRGHRSKSRAQSEWEPRWSSPPPIPPPTSWRLSRSRPLSASSVRGRVRFDGQAHRALLRGQRSRPRTRLPRHRRGQPNEHADMSARGADAHDDVSAHGFRSRRR